ncbi:hypothetical protein RUMHYD_02241 [Blautia hydrogenotrophica DSM 10507]|uniref:Uncharacterized protein n=1 Tax=Blautia hydrogenotrophica (strain DSM 10507 / JCM 14656 / S5a33) TaxID=476272 RepID=C0CN03_BLAHS|nr:hypothetical protein RUMHYD_02241 [Blautia hydrogenotrophica DSM 10507]
MKIQYFLPPLFTLLLIFNAKLYKSKEKLQVLQKIPIHKRMLIAFFSKIG